MPPKPKYTKEEVAAAALEIIKEEGLDALTARSLGARLHTSASPVFTVFDSMDAVKAAARALAFAEFMEDVNDYSQYTPAFKRIGMMVVSYGIHKPELFKLLFMQEHTDRHGFGSTVRDFGELADICLALIERDCGLSHDEAEILFEEMWTQAFGLGAMCAMGVCDLSEEEIGRRLGISFAGTVMLIKSGRLTEVYEDIEHGSNGTYHGLPVDRMPF